jgi:2,3,4,5-tetrahydropyridine-2,6-dicarboxylate N-succinyltransferase
VAHVLGELDAGTLRVAEKIDGEWTTHQWIKKAVLLSFRLEDNVLMDGGPMRYFDKVPTKFANYDAQLPEGRLPRGAAGRGAARQLHRPQRGADAQLREHRRLRR